MGFNESILSGAATSCTSKGVRIRFVGRRDWRVPRRLVRQMDESLALTERNRR
jgi:undecaprenyl diphosphate synthase